MRSPLTSFTTRRTFIGGSALAALTSCGEPPAPTQKITTGPPPRPVPDAGPAAPPIATVEEVIARALDAAKKAGASYADARVVRRRTEAIHTREDHVVSVEFSETYGIGVRVIADGAWGFASTALVEPSAAEEAARTAVTIAKAAKSALKRPVELAAAPVVNGKWRTEMKIDPFEVPLADKAA